jgi:hypothetical protein
MTDTQWKALWRHAAPPVYQSTEALKPMLQARTRPVFRRIRSQLLWEAFAFSVILLSYYDAFDGARRPLYAHVVLISVAVAILLHSVIGYLRFRPRKETAHLKEALERQLRRMRVYAVYSVFSRGAWTLAMAVFFSTALTAHGWVLPVTFGLLLTTQVIWLSHIWGARMRVLRDVVGEMSA